MAVSRYASMGAAVLLAFTPTSSQGGDYWGGLNLAVGLGGAVSQVDLSSISRWQEVDWTTFVGGWGSSGTELGSIEQSINIFGTAQVGYDFQIGRGGILGMFVSIDDRTGGNEFRMSPHPDATPGNIGIDSILSVGARLGVIISDDALVYAHAGYSWADVEIECRDCAARDHEFDLTMGGIAVGGGFERRLWGGVFVRGEYTATMLAGRDFVDEFVVFDDLGMSFSQTVSRVTDMLDHSVKASIVWRP